MRIIVIVNADGHVAGATAEPARPERRAGHPSAWLVAGPGQHLVEVDIADDLVPRPESAVVEVERFFRELATRAAGSTATSR